MGSRKSGDVDKKGRPSPALGQPRSVPGRRAWWLLAGVGCVALATCSWWWIRQPALDHTAAANAEIEALKKESLDIVQALATADPEKKLHGLKLLGMVHNLYGDTDKAMSCWQQAADLAPDRPDLYAAIASIAVQKGEYEKAVVICRAGLAKTAGMPAVYCCLAGALINAGRPDEAIIELQRAIKMSPQDDEAHSLLGKSYSLLNEPEKAKGSYETVLRLRPDDSSAFYGLATACAKLGLADESKRAMEQYQKLWKAGMTTQRDRRGVAFDVGWCRSALARTCAEAAEVYLAFHDPAKAEKLLRRGAEVDPKDLSCRTRLAMLLMKVNRAEDAIRICKEVIAIEPKNPANYLALAMFYAQLGRIDDARSMAHQAVKIDPRNEECRRFLQQLLKRRGVK